jgi:hypothetical protein
MKGASFADVAAIQERVTAVLWSIPKVAFPDSFQKLNERCQQCVEKGWRLFWRPIRLICLYLLFCLFSGTIHRAFGTHHVGMLWTHRGHGYLSAVRIACC